MDTLFLLFERAAIKFKCIFGRKTRHNDITRIEFEGVVYRREDGFGRPIVSTDDEALNNTPLTLPPNVQDATGTRAPGAAI